MVYEERIALNYECSKCNERMGLYERKSAVLDGDFEWVCSTIESQNIYGRTPMIILLTMRLSRLFVKIRCHAVASTRKKISSKKSSPLVITAASIHPTNPVSIENSSGREPEIFVRIQYSLVSGMGLEDEIPGQASISSYDNGSKLCD
ncbi:hypothetical protein TNCV_1415651 [Trichonephila clavipes]|nr:hypothetical protein TNCV_1415651 [Trichonephila clavipes]